MEKKFILDGIRDNKWLSSFEFWEGVINLMIEREIQKILLVKQWIVQTV